MQLPGPSLLAENSLFHTIGEIFHPVFVLFANLLAAIFSVVPNYAISIVILTVIVMGVLTPLTVKSTKSMIAMQEIQPEIKKLQQKYKGAENREQLNQEMMRLYKERHINPAGGCLPMLLQMPFLIVLYDTIRGITNTVVVHGKTVAQPMYISHGSLLYRDLKASGGKMVSFGMNLADKPFSHHSSVWAAIPFFVLVALAVGLQYFQMAQMTRRNPAAAQANKQMAMMQKFMPLVMAYIYFLVPAAVVIYMIVSTIIRIATQDIIFRMGIVQPARVERSLPGGAREGGTGAKGLPSPAPALTDGGGGWRRLLRRPGGDDDAGLDAAIPASSSTKDLSSSRGKTITAGKGGGRPNGKAGGSKASNGRGASSGERSKGGRAKSGAASTTATTATSRSANGPPRSGRSGGGRPGNGRRPSRPAAGGDAGGSDAGAKAHPRAKSKRERKAR